MKENIINIFRMGIWGIPGIILAFILNYIFNEYFEWNVYGAYILVTLCISTLNFLIIDNIIFKQDKSYTTRKRVYGYLIVVFSSKIGEWAMYALLIWFFNLYYLLAQLIVSMLFLIYKFFFLKKVHV